MSMLVTAKIRLQAKNVTGDEIDPKRTATLNFAADYMDGRNKQWSAATPALSLAMTVKGDVGDNFSVGDAFTLTFEKD
jgi:hypothetical protein